MLDHKNLIEVLNAAAVPAGADRHVGFIEGAESESTLTFPSLREHALALLGGLQERGVAPGDQVIVASTDNRLFLEAFWACQYGGFVPVPLSIGASHEHRAKVFRVYEKLDRPRLLVDGQGHERLRKYAEKAGLPEVAALLLEDLASGANGEPGRSADPEPDDLALIQFSSGSTSEPKGVMLSHANLMANLAGLAERSELTPDDVALSWMPLTHDMGLIALHLSMVAQRETHWLMPTDLFTRRPLLWLSKAAEKGASILGSPNFGYKHYLRALRSKGPRTGLDLSKVRLIMNGAEPISVPLCHEFIDALEPYGLPRTALQTVYGLAEATVGVAIPVLGGEFEYLTLDRGKLGVGDEVAILPADDEAGVAFPIEGPPFILLEARVVDDDGLNLDEGRIGHLEIRGASVTRGYFENERANAEALREDGWLDTGDLGLLYDGRIVVTGRAKDILFVFGQNYYPQDLEGAAVGAEGVELGKVVALGYRPPGGENDEVLVFVQYRGRPGDFLSTAAEVSRRVNEQVGIEVNQVLPVRRIPRTTSGKMQRHALERDYADGAFDEIKRELERLRDAAATAAGEASNPLEAALLEITSEVLPERQLGLGDNLFEIGLSSLDLAQIHERIDERHPGSVDIMDLFDHPTLKELAAFLDSRLAAAAS